MSENINSLIENEISEAINSEKSLEYSNKGLGEIFAYIDILKKKEIKLLSVLKHLIPKEKYEYCPICNLKINSILEEESDKYLSDLSSINEDDWLLP